MNKIGLKLWNTNTDSYFDIVQDLYRKKFFDYIELYIVPDKIENLKKWKSLSIPFDIHAPHFAHNMNLSKSDLKDSNLKKYNEVKLYADELNASVIVFHGGSGGSYIETAKQLKSFNEPRALIENKPYEPLPFVKEPYYVGAKYEELKYIIDNADCKFCLDIGHAICAANSFKIQPYSYIEKLVTLKHKRIHLSDIHTDTALDEHLNYGKGNLDINKVISLLPYDVNITIETNKKSKKNLDDYISDVEYLKEKLCKKQ